MKDLFSIESSIVPDISDKDKEQLLLNIHALTGYDITDIKSILKAYELCIVEEVADKATSSDTLPKSLSTYVPFIGSLNITPLFGGRTSTSMTYTLSPCESFHNDIVSAYYYGRTSLDSTVSDIAKDKLTTQYRNIIQKEVL